MAGPHYVFFQFHSQLFSLSSLSPSHFHDISESYATYGAKGAIHSPPKSIRGHEIT